MNRSLLIFSAIILLFGSQTVFADSADTWEGNHLYEVLTVSLANSEYAEYIPLVMLVQAASADVAPRGGIRNNRYFLESVRYTNLAQQAFDEADYDASTQYSEEAVRYAQLSDDFVRLQLKIRETDEAIAAARRRLDYAASVNAASRYPYEFGQAQSAYNEARDLRAAERWDDAIAAANRVLNALAYVTEQGAAPVATAPPATVAQQPPAGTQQPAAVTQQSGPEVLPSQYTVRSWSLTRDCLWNIAGRPYVYNDPEKWKLLYDANKSRMPETNNPDLIHPDMILDIPSVRGERRQGMWDSYKTYQPLP